MLNRLTFIPPPVDVATSYVGACVYQKPERTRRPMSGAIVGYLDAHLTHPHAATTVICHVQVFEELDVPRGRLCR